MTALHKPPVSKRSTMPIDREFNKMRIRHDIDLMLGAERTSREWGERLIAQADNMLVGINDLEQKLVDLDDADFVEELAGGPAFVAPGVH